MTITRVFKTASFAKSARKDRITDAALCEAIQEVMQGQFAADLGGGVCKKRPNKNMHRSIILAKCGKRWIYEYLFAKNERDNIDEDEEQGYKLLAKTYTALTITQLDALVANKKLIEICHDRKKTNPKSARLASMHASAAALHGVGAMDEKTMRHFDALCIEPVASLAPEEIKSIRTTNKLSQALFARMINTSASTVQKWESGQKRPSGLALKMLQVVKHRGIDVLLT